jgi:hypothetical protein
LAPRPDRLNGRRFCILDHPALELDDRHQTLAAPPDHAELGGDVLVEEVGAYPDGGRRLARGQGVARDAGDDLLHRRSASGRRRRGALRHAEPSVFETLLLTLPTMGTGYGNCQPVL